MTLAATLLLSSSDVFSKILVQSLPPIEVAWLRFASFVPLVLLTAAWKGPPRILATRNLSLQILRGLCLVFSTILFATGLKYLPVAEATAIGFVWPIFAMALSVPFLSERIGPRRWSAAVIGLVGVLIVVRPGTSTFQLAALFPVASALVWSGALIITRKMSGFEDPLTTLTFSGFAGFFVTIALLPFVWREPSMTEIAAGFMIGALTVSGHFLVILACRFCSASVLAPLFYAQLIWATVFGILVLNSYPDIGTLAGGAVILASGLYIAHRERVRAAARRLEDVGRLP